MLHLFAAALLLAANTSDVMFDRETVVITGDDKINGPAIGAGVIIGNDRGIVRILTAGHVADMADLQVHFFRGEAETPERVAYDVNNDIGVVYVRVMYGYPIAPIAQQLPSAGANVTVVGHPQGNLYTHSTASVIGFYGVAPIVTPVLSCESCDHGDSGGGVFDAQGDLVGVISSRATIHVSGGAYSATGTSMTGWFPDALTSITAFLTSH